MIKNNKRITMEEIWMETAINLSLRSKCSKACVGCVITTSNLRHVLANGYNGYAKNYDNYICTPETCNCLHAECNAVIDSSSEQKDKVFFVTMFPCLSCTIQIINSGCSILYFHDVYKEGSKHWKNYPEIIKLLNSNNILIKKI